MSGVLKFGSSTDLIPPASRQLRYLRLVDAGDLFDGFQSYN